MHFFQKLFFRETESKSLSKFSNKKYYQVILVFSSGLFSRFHSSDSPLSSSQKLKKQPRKKFSNLTQVKFRQVLNLTTTPTYSYINLSIDTSSQTMIKINYTLYLFKTIRYCVQLGLQQSLTSGKDFQIILRTVTHQQF